MQKLKQIFIYIGLVSLLLNPTLVLAQAANNTNSTPGANVNANSSKGGIGTQYTYQGVDQSVTQYLCTPSEPADGKDLQRCINKIYRFGIAFGAIAVVFFFVVAGYIYITGGEASKAKAKGIVQNSLTGLAILLASYLILSFINPNLTTIKPIQPPIFVASDLPTCEEIGFEDDCIVLSPDGTTSVVTAAGGAKVACPGGKIVSAKGLGLPTKQSDEQICEEFGKLIVQAKSKLNGLDWRITDTIGTGHLSSCHKAGNAYSGTCADIGLVTKTTAGWNQVCRAMKEVGLTPVNEADNAAGDCPKYGTYATTTGQHIHVNWRK